MESSASRPLLPERTGQSTADEGGNGDNAWSTIERLYPARARKQTRRFLSSKYGHYAVLLLVSLDVSCIFADFLISLYICDHTCSKGKAVGKGLPEAQDALGIVSLIFSCLFMVELLASVWAFGFE